MALPSKEQKNSLWNSTASYQKALKGSPAEEYLVGRGLTGEVVVKQGLGFVAEPHPGHEAYAGWLAIPYLRWSPTSKWSCISIRFRCIEDHDHSQHGGKYMAAKGYGTPHIYNAPALLENSPIIDLQEGEIDALSVQVAAGIPAVGVPGVEAWQPFWAEAFKGYEVVHSFVDGDKAGKDFAEKLAKQLPNFRAHQLPAGEDANSMLRGQGVSYFTERVK